MIHTTHSCSTTKVTTASIIESMKKIRGMFPPRPTVRLCEFLKQGTALHMKRLNVIFVSTDVMEMIQARPELRDMIARLPEVEANRTDPEPTDESEIG